MNEALVSALIIFSAYLAGSVPFAYLLGRLRGFDVRDHGSGNVGATNLTRLAGRRWGFAAFFLDFGKGMLAVAAAAWLAPDQVGTLLPMLAAAAVVAGHVWPVWLGFKGGKGMATSLGALLVLSPWATILAAVVWAVVFLLCRYVSLASMAAAVMLPVGDYLAARRFETEQFSAVRLLLLGMIALFIVWRHRQNLRRLLDGSEYRF